MKRSRSRSTRAIHRRKRTLQRRNRTREIQRRKRTIQKSYRRKRSRRKHKRQKIVKSKSLLRGGSRGERCKCCRERSDYHDPSSEPEYDPEPEPESPWVGLNPDIQNMFANYLGDKDLKSLSSTNRPTRSSLSEVLGLRQGRRIKLKQFRLKPEDEEVDLSRQLIHTGLTAELGEALGMMTELQELRLDNNQIRDVECHPPVLTPLQGMIALHNLDLSFNQIRDVSPLQWMTALQVLYLDYNQIQDVVPLAGLTVLTELYLYNNQIQDVAPLAWLTALKTLDLGGNQISNVSPLKGMTALKRLVLRHNTISNVIPLAKLEALQVLDLSYNQISNVSPLQEMTALQELWLGENQISDNDPTILALKGRGADVFL